jgi:hypothetical protein
MGEIVERERDWWKDIYVFSCSMLAFGLGLVYMRKVFGF